MSNSTVHRHNHSCVLDQPQICWQSPLPTRQTPRRLFIFRVSPKQLGAGVVEIGSSSHYLTMRIWDRAMGLSSVTGSSLRLRRQQASILLAWANARLVWYAGVKSNQLICFQNESRRAGAGVLTTPFIPPWLSAPCVLLHGIARPSGPIEITCYIYSTLNAVKFLM